MLEVETTSRGKIAEIVLSNPPRNFITQELLQQLVLGMQQVLNSSVTVAIIRGNDADFSTGMDILEFLHAMREIEDEERRKKNHLEIHSVLDAIEEANIIFIAAIEGLCLGGGLELALTCDLRIAGKGARLGFPEILLGLIPGWGGTQRLPKVIGVSRANEMILSGRALKAREAFQIGLIDHLTEDNAAVKHARKLARRMARNDPNALSAAKSAIQAGLAGEKKYGIRKEIDCFHSLCDRGDLMDNIEAIMTP